MAIQCLNREFHNYLEEMMYSSVNLEDPYDRVTIMQWIRKLQSMDDSTYKNVNLRNQYANYLRIALGSTAGHLCAPFNKPPVESELRPLCEVLANYVATKCPPIPMTGPIEPIMSQTSSDGKVFTSVKQTEGGIFCYMAVTPDSFEETN